MGVTMNFFKEFLGKYTDVSKQVRMFLLATLINNIGNGVHTIVVSKLLYDKTNSAMAFGGVIIIQYVVMFMTQLLAGSTVDRNNSKKIIMYCHLIRGSLILVSGLLFMFTNMGVVFLFITLIIVNIVRPFSLSAHFSILPMLIEDKNQLLKANSMVGTLVQVGQLTGCALIAPIIYYLNTSVGLVLDGMTFFLSSILICVVRINYCEIKKDNDKNMCIKFIDDWKEIGKAVKKEKSLLAHLIISSGNYISINLFNLMLVPMVTLWYGNNSFYISLYDGAFALGAMFLVAFIVNLSKKLGLNNSAFLGFLVQAISFQLLILTRNPLITVIIIFMFGMANSFSLSVFNSNLQLRCNGPIKGRISSFRNMIVSIITIIIIPIISKLHDINIVYGLLASTILVFTYSSVSLLLGSKFIFGDDYLSKQIKVLNTESKTL
jgi:MFS family permease